MLVPALMAMLAAAAIGYNELSNKGKTVRELVRAAPALVVYYHVRLAGFLWRWGQMRCGVKPVGRIDPEEIARQLPSPPEHQA